MSSPEPTLRSHSPDRATVAEALLGRQKEYEPSMDMMAQIVYYCESGFPIVIPTLTFSSSPPQHGGP